jgi:hypothetical protein
MNLINELQVSAERDDVLTVLRKTKRLASKLDRQDIVDWLRAEQDGYPPSQTVPHYREVGMTIAYNTNGYIPAGFGYLRSGIEDLPASRFNCSLPLKEPISTILSFIESINAGQGVYNPIEEGTEISRAIRSTFRFHPMFARQISFLMHFNGAQIVAIPEQIKDKVLDWACALEQAGVTGEGLTFSAEEKQKAHSITFNITESHIEQLNNLGTNQRGDQ